MRTAVLSLLMIFLASQCGANYTDQKIVEARMKLLTDSLDPMCAMYYKDCSKRNSEEYSEENDLNSDYCTRIKRLESCVVKAQMNDWGENRHCTEKVEGVACMCKEDIAAFRTLTYLALNLSSDCSSHVVECTGAEDVDSLGVTIKEYCDSLTRHKNCFTSSTKCPSDTYDKFERAACHGTCGSIKVAQSGFLLMIIISLSWFLQ